MSATRFDPALGLSGLAFGQVAHLRWSASRFARYPAFGCQLFQIDSATMQANLLGEVAGYREPQDRSSLPDYGIVEYEHNALNRRLMHAGEDLGHGQWVAHDHPWQVDLRAAPSPATSFQLTLVGASDPSQLARVSVLGQSGAVQQYDVEQRHLEMKTLYREEAEPIRSIRVEGAAALVIRLELFADGWSRWITPSAAVLTHPLRVTDNLDVIRARLGAAAPPDLQAWRDSGDLSMFRDLLAAEDDAGLAPWFREAEIPSSGRRFRSSVGEDEGFYRVHPVDLLNLMNLDADFARLTGHYVEDANPEAGYLLTAHDHDPGNIDPATGLLSGLPDPATIRTVAVAPEVLPEQAVPLRQLSSLRASDIQQSGDPNLRGAHGLILDWQMAPPLGAAHTAPVLFFLRRGERNVAPGRDDGDFEKSFVLSATETPRYLDLVEPHNMPLERVFDYTLHGVDLWGRTTRAQTLVGARYSYQPNAQAPIGLKVDFVGENAAEVSFLWGRDACRSHGAIHRFDVWLCGDRVKGIYGEVLQVEPSGVVKLSPEAGLNPSEVSGHWNLEIGGKPCPEFRVTSADASAITVKLPSGNDVEVDQSFALQRDWSESDSWDAVVRDGRGLKSEIALTDYAAPEEHTIEVESLSDTVKVTFPNGAPFAGRPGVRAGSVYQTDDHEYLLDPVLDEDGRPLANSFLVRSPVREDHYVLVPENGTALVYPRFSHVFEGVPVDRARPLGVTRAWALAVRARHQPPGGGPAQQSPISNRQLAYWVDASVPQTPQRKTPLPHEVPVASAADYHGKSTWTVSWPVQVGVRYHLYRASDDALLSEARLQGDGDVPDLDTWRAMADRDRLRLLNDWSSKPYASEIFEQQTREPLRSGGVTARYSDRDLDGRSSAWYVYRVTAVAENGLESPLSGVISVVRSPQQSVMQAPAIREVRPLGGGLAIRWNHLADEDLGYYLLLRTSWWAADDKPNLEALHWRGFRSKFALPPDEHVASLRAEFGTPGLALQPHQTIDAVFTLADARSVAQQLGANLETLTHAQLKSVGASNHYRATGSLEGVVSLPNDTEIVVYVREEEDSQSQPLWNRPSEREFIDKSATAGDKIYAYMLLTVSKDEQRLSSRGIPMLGQPLPNKRGA